MTRRFLHSVINSCVETLSLAAAYVVTAKVGFLLAIPPGNVTVLWPPSGIALAALLRRGTRAVPGIWLGSFCANVLFFMTTGTETRSALAMAAGIAFGSTIQALLGSRLAVLFLNADSIPIHIGSIIRFVCIGAGSCLVAATIGVLSLTLGGVVPLPSFVKTWATWWMGDFAGILIVTPAALVLAKSLRLRRFAFEDAAFPLFCGGIGLAQIAFCIVRLHEEQRFAAQFEAEAREVAVTLTRSIEADLQATESVVAFYHASHVVDRQQFRAFVLPALERRPTITALSWIPRVTAAQRKRFEESARAELATFQIKERNEHGQLMRAAPRDEYYPVHFIEPVQGNETAIGFDLGSESVRRAAIERMMASGNPAITGPIVLVQERESNQSVLVFWPVYGRDAAKDRRHRGSGKPIGFVSGVVRVADLVDRSLDHLNGRGIELYLFDATGNSEQLLHVHNGNGAGTQTRVQSLEQLESDLHRSMPIEIAGRKWLAVCRPSPEYRGAPPTGQAWFILAGGIGLSSLLGFYLHRRRASEAEIRRANDQLEKLVVEARQDRAYLSSILESAMDSIITVDKNGCVAEFNFAAEKMFGYSRTDALRKEITEFLMPARERDPRRSGFRRFVDTGEGRAANRLLELTAIRSDGSEFPIELTVSSVQLHSTSFCTAIIRDITERKKSDRALRESEELFRLITENSNDLIHLLDVEGCIVFGSPSIARLGGHDPAKMVGTSAFAGVHPDDVELVRQQWPRLLGGETIFATFRLQHADGSWRWIESAASMLVYRDQPHVLSVGRDVTERIQAETAIREAEAKFRSIFDNAVDGIYQSTPDGRFLTANQAMARILGYSAPEELIRERTDIARQGYVRPERRDEFRRLVAEMGSVSGFESEFRRKDGQSVWVSESARAIHDDAGNIVRYEGTLEDISARKHALSALEENYSLLRAVVDGVPDALFVKDLQGRYVMINPPGARFIGRPIEEIIGKCDSELFSAETGNRAYEHDRHVVETGEVLTIEETATAAGATRVYLSTKSVYRDNAGKVIGLIGIARDITEQRSAIEALQRSEERYRSLVDGSIQGIAILQDSILHYVNQRFAGTFGYDSPAALIGRNRDVLVAPEYLPQLRARSNACISGKGVDSLAQWEGIRRDGKRIWIESGAARIEWNNSPAILSFVIDVTERKLLEEQFRQAQKLEAIGRLAGGIAHDFNNLLTVINGYAEIAMDSLESAHPCQTALEEIRHAGTRAAALTNQLLIFSRKQTVRPVVLDLNQLVAGMETMLRRLIGEDIEIVKSLDRTLLPVLADRGQIEQVIMNLAVNARDAMPAGGQLRLRTAVAAEVPSKQPNSAPGPYATLAVEDTGSGMSPEVMSRIFEPFFTTKSVGKGTGLGLSTVYGIVNQCGGFVNVESELGRGTRFTISLPLADRSPQPSLNDPTPIPLPRGSETVLLVEDEDRLRNLVHGVLRQSGYHVLEARNGRHGLLVSGRHSESIDLLVTDVVMPEMGGVELASQLVSQRPSLRVLFMSGYAENSALPKDVMNKRFLQKPFSSSILVQKVRQVLDEKSETTC